MKLGIGTVQFGMNYGVSNAQGVTCEKDVAQILQYATASGITMLDTATAYAESEAVLGRMHPGLLSFDIVTKTLPIEGDVTVTEIERVLSVFESSLKKMRLAQLYGLLVHKADNILGKNGDRLFSVLQGLKDDGKVKKIGVSVYDRDTLDMVLEHFPIDIVQLPLNVFDQRFIDDGYLSKIRSVGVEVHSRSVFLQGLLLMSMEQVPSYFEPLMPHLKSYHAYLTGRGLSPLAGALGFALSLQELDVILCGVNNLQHLIEIVSVAQNIKVDPAEFAQFSMRDEMMINPALWNI